MNSFRITKVLAHRFSMGMPFQSFPQVRKHPILNSLNQLIRAVITLNANRNRFFNDRCCVNLSISKNLDLMVFLDKTSGQWN